MKVKIFDFGQFKGMIIGNETGTELYMQIKTSHWFFCVGDLESFKSWDDEKGVQMICNDYFEQVESDEELLINN